MLKKKYINLHIVNNSERRYILIFRIALNFVTL